MTSFILSDLKEHMDVSKTSGTPKWMVKIMENPTKMDDLGGRPTPIFGFNTHNGEICCWTSNPDIQTR